MSAALGHDSNGPQYARKGPSSQGPAPDIPSLKAKLHTLQAENLPLTIGVEIECLLACTRILIYSVLSQGLSGRCATCGETHQFKLPISRPDLNTGDHDKWSIVSDSSIGLTQEERETLERSGSLEYCQIHSIELRTRILCTNRNLRTSPSSTNPDHTHEIDYRGEITAVLDALHDTFNSTKAHNKSCLFVNETCGLHVHIGQGELGFPLRTIKNILSTYVINERQIDSMHGVDRICGSLLPCVVQCQRDLDKPRESASYNLPLSDHHHAWVYESRTTRLHGSNACDDVATMRDIRPRYPLDFVQVPTVAQALNTYSLDAAAQLIQKAPDLAALRSLHHNRGHSSTVNVDNLGDYGSRPCGALMTVEFRQHAGALEPVEIIPWTDVLVSLVQFADRTTDAEFAGLRDAWQSSDHHTMDLLTTLGCSADILQHYRCRLGLQRHDTDDYALQLQQRQMQEYARRPPSDLLKPLVLRNIFERIAHHAPTRVRKKISCKFETGGYGQFSPEFLNHLKLEPGVKQKLTLGWGEPEAAPTAPRVVEAISRASDPRQMCEADHFAGWFGAEGAAGEEESHMSNDTMGPPETTSRLTELGGLGKVIEGLFVDR